MNTLPALNDFLLYENPYVIKRFEINFPNEAHRSKELFTDMLRYLWLCEKHFLDKKENPNDESLDFIPVMHQEMRAIDNMWHEFILITKDYQDFCNKFFGKFIHHEPNMQETLEYNEDNYVKSLSLFLSYTYDVLGETVVKNWFKDHLQDF